MAGSFSDYLENALLNRLFRGVNYTFPTTLYFAAFTVAPSDSGGGTEVAGGGYARVAIAVNTSNFTAATAGTLENAVPITWPTATANWGTVVAVAVFDASMGGNMLFWTTLNTAKTVNSGDTLQINSGDFDWSLD